MTVFPCPNCKTTNVNYQSCPMCGYDPNVVTCSLKPLSVTDDRDLTWGDELMTADAARDLRKERDEAVDKALSLAAEVNRLAGQLNSARAANLAEFEGHKLTVSKLMDAERERDQALAAYDKVVDEHERWDKRRLTEMEQLRRDLANERQISDGCRADASRNAELSIKYGNELIRIKNTVSDVADAICMEFWGEATGRHAEAQDVERLILQWLEGK